MAAPSNDRFGDKLGRLFRPSPGIAPDRLAWRYGLVGVVALLGLLAVWRAGTSTGRNANDADPEALAALRVSVDEPDQGRRAGRPATLTLANGNAFDLRDLRVRCRHDDRDGRPLPPTEATIHDVVRARASLAVRDLGLGLVPAGAVSTSCLPSAGMRVPGSERAPASGG